MHFFSSKNGQFTFCVIMNSISTIDLRFNNNVDLEGGLLTSCDIISRSLVNIDFTCLHIKCMATSVLSCEPDRFK